MVHANWEDFHKRTLQRDGENIRKPQEGAVPDTVNGGALPGGRVRSGYQSPGVSKLKGQGLRTGAATSGRWRECRLGASSP